VDTGFVERAPVPGSLMISNDFVGVEEQRFKSGDADSYNKVADHFDQYTERFTSRTFAGDGECPGQW